MRGEVKPYRFAGCGADMCTTSIVRREISCTFPCVVTLKQGMAMCKQETLRRECPAPVCNATPWVLNIKTHLAGCHPTVALNTVDLTE